MTIISSRVLAALRLVERHRVTGGPNAGKTYVRLVAYLDHADADALTGAMRDAQTTAPLHVTCYYATKPDVRPRCQAIAVIRYGDIALCDSCDQQRSTIGKGQKGQRI